MESKYIKEAKEKISNQFNVNKNKIKLIEDNDVEMEFEIKTEGVIISIKYKKSVKCGKVII